MENEKQISYPIENRYNFKALAFFILALSLLSIDGFSLRYGILSFLLDIIVVVIAILLFMSIRRKVYVIDCPYCHQKTDFPINAQGADCSCCQKRIILANGAFQCTDDLENNSRV